MVKSYKLANLECANCAAKMEADIAKLPQVNDAKIAFMTCRMKLDVPEGTDMDTLLDEVQDIIWKYESDCTISR